MSVTPIEPSARATYNLGINASQLGIGRHADKFSIKNVYIDVDDTHIKVVPFDFTDDVDDNGSVLALPATTIGSAYQTQFYAAGKMLLSAYFEMPERDCSLAELKLYTAMPAREQYPEGAPGKSAYQSAIDTGVFEGTEEQFAQWQKPTINDVDLLADIKVINDVATLPAGVTVPRRIGSDVYTLSTFNDRLADVDKVLTQTGGTVDIGGVPVKTIKQATDDALNVATAPIYDFVDAGKDEVVERPLGPSFRSLNHYLEYLEAIKSMFTQATGNVVVDGVTRKSLHQALLEVDSAITSVSDAINNTAVEGGVLADTFVTLTENAGVIARNLRDYRGDARSIKDFGGNGVDDTIPLKNALTTNTRSLNLNTNKPEVNQVNIKTDIALFGTAELVQSEPNRHLLYSVHDTGTPEYINGDYVKGFSAVGLKFGKMGASTSDDFAAIALFESDGAVSAMNTYTEVASGLRISSVPTKFGVPNYGARDTLVLGDRFIKTDRFAVQNLQSQYTRMVGIARHSDRDNSYTKDGGLNNGGFNGGVRLAGQSVGNILAASNIRDSWTGVDLQKGCGYNVLSGNFYENTRSNTINTSNTTNGNSAHNNHNGFVIKDAGGAGIRARYSSANRFNGSIIGTGKTVGESGEGIDLRNSSGTTVKHYRITYTGGSGLVPAAGTVITQGSASATLVSVDKYGVQIAATGTPMPADGELYVKDLNGDFFKAGVLTGVDATAIRCYAADGRHRVDITTADTRASQAVIGSDCNLVDLIILDGSSTSVNIEGSYNNVRIVVADNAAEYKVEVTGNYNIVTVTDNSLKSTVTTRIKGGGNHVTVATSEGSLIVSGSSNVTSVACNTLLITGNKNVVTGNCKILSSITGALNNTKSLIGASQTISFAGLTDTTGKINIDHDLLRVAASADISINGPTPYIVTLSNPSVTDKRAQLSVFKTDGTPAISSSVALTIELTI